MKAKSHKLTIFISREIEIFRDFGSKFGAVTSEATKQAQRLHIFTYFNVFYFQVQFFV